MDDQFGGRTDDDLFYDDDFEPVESESVVVQQVQHAQPPPEPIPAVTSPVTAEPVQSRQPKPKASSLPPQSSTHNAPSAPPTQPQAKGGNLSSSRFARKGNPNMRQQPTPSPPAVAKSPTPPKENKDTPREKEAVPKEKDASPLPNAPTGPAKDKKPYAPQNTAANPESRLQSGANPRQKLTETELAAKMEEMKLLSAEKARKFEKAEKDQQQHAEAYAKGMEDARKRRAEDAERRRRGEEDKRKLDEERAKNRERKLKAMGMKEGGWDEGKEAILEEEAKKGFRGANGGIRGTKRGGLSGSRFAREGEELPDVDRFLDDRQRGSRGRGRGGRGSGRGRDGGPALRPTNSKTPAPSLTADEFPALPSDGKKKPSQPASVYPPPKADPAPVLSLPIPPLQGGKWDDEMEALDELKQQG
ncbi:hypothetical protein QQS21_010548 [Conoideocrella luteorostrata]|uniref:Uncharacterized protein n=1 Tax=Conoideocrella luteorostrata TaxID=1105319 RepID=A0AAJ0CET6_9HYPO|nr:hypothetical protein QQS21_010548 [Conoideocrella luteorostrata]